MAQLARPSSLMPKVPPRSVKPLSRLSRIDSIAKGFFYGGTQAGGADFAESVAALEPLHKGSE